MAETIGSLVDKICIAELKIFHMQEQVDRADAAPEHKQKCQDRLTILLRQRNDLAEELSGLYAGWRQGTWQPKVYRQFKMYNDPQYRVPEKSGHGR